MQVLVSLVSIMGMVLGGLLALVAVNVFQVVAALSVVLVFLAQALIASMH